MKKYRNVFSLLAGIAVVFCVVFLVAAHPPQSTPDTGMKPAFPTNINGETYGSAANVAPYGYPDLVAAVGVDGVEGYIRMSEAHPEDPKTPEEAGQWQKELEAKGGFYFCPLYDKEGAVIGKMQIGPNGPAEITPANDEVGKTP